MVNPIGANYMQRTSVGLRDRIPGCRLHDADGGTVSTRSIRADDRDDLVARIKEFGVREFEEISDEKNFFFQAPGGQVYVC